MPSKCCYLMVLSLEWREAVRDFYSPIPNSNSDVSHSLNIRTHLVSCCFTFNRTLSVTLVLNLSRLSHLVCHIFPTSFHCWLADPIIKIIISSNYCSVWLLLYDCRTNAALYIIIPLYFKNCVLCKTMYHMSPYLNMIGMYWPIEFIYFRLINTFHNHVFQTV